jgi:hypothetical protein
MARSAEEADRIALEQAGDLNYSEKSAEYELVHPAAPAPREPGCGRVMELMLEMRADDSSAFSPSTSVKGAVLHVSESTMRRWQDLAKMCADHELAEVHIFAGAVECFGRFVSVDDQLAPDIEGAKICCTATELWLEGVERANGLQIFSLSVDLRALSRFFHSGCERLVGASDPLELLECLGDDRARAYAPGPTSALLARDSMSQVGLDEFDRYFQIEPVAARER